ncbi:SPOR domain-containing protein [Devosia sediminis]|uniref:SPOR domain-containing protein n=1 Tax=Devosia sediminis TaxID=2798801 RepID=A0A934IRP5_9HYPH|nr:SPOR domain-containing protein [Devosia sediminis]MBJ3785559.1 SPOR domain-containing protein [Devosia sediminis]
MAAQTDAPDDLIAELARLMADDAKVTPPPANDKSAPIRIPGDAPGPRFDFSASSNLASNQAPASPVRIPGADAAPAASANNEAFPFNFDFTPSVAKPPAAPAPVPTTPAPVVAPAQPVPPAEQPVSAADETGELDHDSLADLIAAELAADLGADRQPESAAPVAPAPAKPAADSFGVPPVFGLGSSQPVASSAPVAREPAPTPAPQAPRPEVAARAREDDAVDPLDEIERLVGPAVRLNTASPAPAPALRSLATPVMPEPVIPEPAKAQPAPAPAAIGSVDEAILAAAAATGAHVEWVNAGSPDVDDIAMEAEPEVAPARSRVRGFRMSRAVAGPLVAVGLLAIAGFGLYWLLGQGGATTGPAPVIVADTTPTKEVPEVDTSASAQQSVVFNEISGASANVEEQIVSRDQSDTEAVVAANTPAATSGVIPDATGTTVDPNQDGLVNRKVRTVTVRPDGTIVSGDDSMAGTAILPVDRPNVPDVPGADFTTPDLIANASAEAEAAAATTPIDPATVPATPTAPAAEPGSSIAVVDATGQPITGRSVTVPMQRPSDFSAMASAAIASANAAPALAAPNTTTTATTPVAAAPQEAAPTATAPTGTAAAYVQLASQRSEAEAQATVQAINTRYGVLFGGASPQIQRVDLGERGIYYRVLVPAASREGAANICTNVKAAGGDCLVL